MPRPRAARLVVALAASVLALTGCTDSTAAPPAPTSTVPATGGEAGSRPREGEGGRGGDTPSRRTTVAPPTTVPPTSGNYDPNKCPAGLVC